MPAPFMPALMAHLRLVSGTCRDQEACENFRSEGVDAHVLDADNEQLLRSGSDWHG